MLAMTPFVLLLDKVRCADWCQQEDADHRLRVICVNDLPIPVITPMSHAKCAGGPDLQIADANCSVTQSSVSSSCKMWQAYTATSPPGVHVGILLFRQHGSQLRCTYAPMTHQLSWHDCNVPRRRNLCRRRLWQHKVNNMWARASTTPWYPIQVHSAPCCEGFCPLATCTSPTHPRTSPPTNMGARWTWI